MTAQSEILLKPGTAADDANGMRDTGASPTTTDVAEPHSESRRVPYRSLRHGALGYGALGYGALGYGAFRAVDPADDLAAPRAMRVRALRDAVRSGRYAPSSEGVAEALLVWCVEPFPGPRALARAR